MTRQRTAHPPLTRSPSVATDSAVSNAEPIGAPLTWCHSVGARPGKSFGLLAWEQVCRRWALAVSGLAVG